MIFKDIGLQKSYDNEGYAKASILAPDEVEGLLSELVKLLTNGGIASSDAKENRPTYHVSFLDTNQNYRRRVFDLVESYFAFKLRDIMPGYHILNTSLVIKPPRGGIFSVHHDWSFLANPVEKCMTVWCPLVDTDTENRTIHLLPGSNKLLEEIQTPRVPCYFHSFGDKFIECWLQAIPTQAGHALLWDHHMIHWSGVNHSKIPRIAVQITCIPIHSQPVYFYYDEKRPDLFELIHADQEFWLTTDHHQIFSRQPNWKSPGYIPNRNRLISEIEFSELLRTTRGSWRSE